MAQERYDTCSIAEPELMKIIKRLYRAMRDFFVQYPAVVSGYIIYSYLFLSTMKFFLDKKAGHVNTFDIFQRFDSLLWMWLLAVTLVKIIDFRTKLHQRETEQLLHRQEMEVKELQLTTLTEIVRGLQHEINNPLTIIMMTAGKLDKQLLAQPELRESVGTMKTAADRIGKTLEAFSQAKQYEVDSSPVGNIIKPPDATDKHTP